MATKKKLHPREKALLKKCKQINLSKEQTELTRDLMGWNAGKDMPRSHGSIEPYTQTIVHFDKASTGKVRQENQDRAKECRLITKLFHDIMGPNIKAHFRKDPIGVLEDTLKMPRPCIVWLIHQLHIGRKRKQFAEYAKEVDSMRYRSPDELGPIVLATIGRLLFSRE